MQTEEHSGCNARKPELSTYHGHIDSINDVHRGIPYFSELQTEDHFGCSVTPYVQNLFRTIDFGQVNLKDWAIFDSGATATS